MITRREQLRKYAKRLANRIAGRRGLSVPVYIFGEMRSGTNMLLQAFDSCLATEIYNETDDDAFRDYELRPADVISALVDRSPASHVVFKTTADSSRADEVLDSIAGGRGIWIYRGFADVVNSALVSFSEHKEYLRLIARRDSKAAWRARNLSAQQLHLIEDALSRDVSEASARALIWWMRNSHYFSLGLDRRSDVLLMNYEDLVRQPIENIAAAFSFVELRFNQGHARHVVSSSVRKRQPPSIDREIECLCHALLERLEGTRRGCSR